MLNSELPQGIKVISESFVRPKHDVEAAKQRHYLGPLDLNFMSADLIHKGLLFNLADKEANREHMILALVERLKHSMSIALIHFYPLAGRFVTEKFEDEHACLIYVDCNKGPGARLIHAAMDDLITVSDILSPTDHHVPIAVRSFFDLGEMAISHDCHTNPILSIQVTELLDGVFIGFTISHSVVDGVSLWHFINVLSQIFTSSCDEGDEYVLPASRVPMYKQYCPEGFGPIFKLPYLEPEEFIRRGNNYFYDDPSPLRERFFHFSPTSMAKLKAKANEECDCSNNTITITSFMALSALVWRSITRAFGPSLDEETSCCLAVNVRNRLEPPLSESHFGNFLTMCKGTCKVSDLLSHKLGWAAMILRQEVDKCTHKQIQDFLKVITERPFIFDPHASSTTPSESSNGPCKVAIGGSARLEMYGPEFGLGRAVATRMGHVLKENAKVTANPGREGGGSVDLEIHLKPDIMSALEIDEEFMSFVS